MATANPRVSLEDFCDKIYRLIRESPQSPDCIGELLRQYVVFSEIFSFGRRYVVTILRDLLFDVLLRRITVSKISSSRRFSL